MLYYQEKNYTSAITSLTNALEIDTEEKTILLHRAINYMAEGDMNNALQDLSYCEAPSCIPFVYILRGQIHLSTKLDVIRLAKTNFVVGEGESRCGSCE
jgi:regulator of sirC expression with transglutaminase-like and TPR domain